MKSLVIVYVSLLGISLGVQIAVGAFMAPVIFHPSYYLAEGVLSHFQSGILMTQVFLKTNLLLSVVALYSVLYEMIAWLKKTDKDTLSFFLALLSLLLSAAFVLYYTPFIVNAQAGGELATRTDLFAVMHKQSEWVMKALMLTQCGLLFRRMWLVQKEEKKR